MDNPWTTGGLMSGIGHNNGPKFFEVRIDAAGGWVRVQRDMRRHEIVGFGSLGRYSRAEAWLDLIMECKYEDGVVQNGGRPMKLTAGQMLGAVSWLAQRWGWTPKEVRGFLERLENNQMITLVRNKTETGGQKGKQANVVTISNYGEYQIPEFKKGQTEGHVEGEQRANGGHAEGNIYKDNHLTLNPKKDDKPAVSDDHERPVGERAAFVNGELVLFNGCRAEWLAAFGGEEQLRLALKQAAGFVQPNNRMKSLEAQVSAQLARMVRDKRDKDERYAAAAASKVKTPEPPKPPPRKTYTKEELDQIEYWRKRGVTV